MNNSNYPNYDPVALLIARSTGILGDFKMNVCANIVANERLVLNEDQIARVLRRYRAHVEFWNSPTNAIQSELQAFANGLGQDYNYILQIYETLNWVGLLRYTCGLDSSGWSATLNQNGIENRTYFGHSRNDVTSWSATETIHEPSQ